MRVLSSCGEFGSYVNVLLRSWTEVVDCGRGLRSWTEVVDRGLDCGSGTSPPPLLTTNLGVPLVKRTAQPAARCLPSTMPSTPPSAGLSLRLSVEISLCAEP